MSTKCDITDVFADNTANSSMQHAPPAELNSTPNVQSAPFRIRIRAFEPSATDNDTKENASPTTPCQVRIERLNPILLEFYLSRAARRRMPSQRSDEAADRTAAKLARRHSAIHCERSSEAGSAKKRKPNDATPTVY